MCAERRDMWDMRCHHVATFSSQMRAWYVPIPLSEDWYLIPDLNCLNTPAIFLSISDTWLVTGSGQCWCGQVYTLLTRLGSARPLPTVQQAEQGGKRSPLVADWLLPDSVLFWMMKGEERPQLWHSLALPWSRTFQSKAARKVRETGTGSEPWGLLGECSVFSVSLIFRQITDSAHSRTCGTGGSPRQKWRLPDKKIHWEANIIRNQTWSSTCERTAPRRWRLSSMLSTATPTGRYNIRPWEWETCPSHSSTPRQWAASPRVFTPVRTPWTTLPSPPAPWRPPAPLHSAPTTRGPRPALPPSDSLSLLTSPARSVWESRRHQSFVTLSDTLRTWEVCKSM